LNYKSIAEELAKLDRGASKQKLKRFKFNGGKISGSTRDVFFSMCGRYVYKLGCPSANKLEYVIYNGLKGSPYSSLFAKIYYLSENGRVVVQERCEDFPTIFTFPVECMLMQYLENELDFERKFGIVGVSIKDLHNRNLGLTKIGMLKIIDYGYKYPKRYQLSNFPISNDISLLSSKSKRLEPLYGYLKNNNSLVIVHGKDKNEFLFGNVE